MLIFRCFFSLSARGGSVFKSILETPMLESLENKIEIDNFNSPTIHGFREYLYNGNVSNVTDSPDEFYKFGHQYGLDDVMKLAELEMRNQINRETYNRFHELTLIFLDELKSLESDLKEFVW